MDVGIVASGSSKKIVVAGVIRDTVVGHEIDFFVATDSINGVLNLAGGEPGAISA